MRRRSAALRAQLLLLAVITLLLRAATATAPSQQQQQTWHRGSAAAVEEMLAWLERSGGKVNVLVKELPGRGRITVASHDMQAGDVLAAIPKHVCFEAPRNEQAAAVALWRELHNASSPLAPYMRVLPSRAEVASYYDLPASYLPLIQNPAMAHAIRQVQRGLEGMLDAAGGGSQPRMTSADLRYTTSLLKTRSFDCGQLGELLLPVVDLANHANGCEHTITSHTDCGAQAPGGCVVWRAGRALAAGEEVCNGYHPVMLNDRALLQFGFLADDVARNMSGVDRHDFNPRQPWAFQEGSDLAPFSGTPAQLQAEAARLARLLRRMQALDARMRAAPMARDLERDPDGRLLRQLLQWRSQRKSAIEAELRRLQAMH